MKTKIPLARPHLTGNELRYVQQLLGTGDLSVGGKYTRKAETELERLTRCRRALLTTSCSAALELAACLLNLEPNDEVIVPSFTFVTTASSFARFGAKPVFAEIRGDTCNIDETAVEALITARTRAIIAVHYAGVPAEMPTLRNIAAEQGVALIEDAAQALGALCHGEPVGSLSDLAAFSFHETKNFMCGEGGALCINDSSLIDRAHIIRDKGTNRQEFLVGQTDKYTWVDMGASYVQSELAAAVLVAQLEAIDTITRHRRILYERYLTGLENLQAIGVLTLPIIPDECTSNYHLFHVLLSEPRRRPALLRFLRERGIGASFHYVPLHSSPQGRRLADPTADLPVTDSVAEAIVRLPLYPDLPPEQQDYVIEAVQDFFVNVE